MCLKHEGFQQILTNKDFAKLIAAIIVDECHVASTWGEKFRPTYNHLGSLRSFFPVGVPVLATSATLDPHGLSSTARILEVNLQRAFFLNLGNDRPNIAYSIKVISSPSDLTCLDEFFSGPFTSAEEIEKSMVFANKIKLTQLACEHTRAKLPPELRHTVDYFHALRTPKSKERVLREFKLGIIRILYTSEAAGMVRRHIYIKGGEEYSHNSREPTSQMFLEWYSWVYLQI